ncbi:MAG TPA: zf-HC2 domain-containing protein [Candidatus Hydrogenedentes bacterium]|nr:zf-HC2 domain-containing protein [Candidatus Hydrogenedentota bacterium]
MLGCRKIRGLLAASLYEAPNEDDQATLDRHLANCAACREQARQLRALHDAVPIPPVEFTGDLLPVLRQRLAEESTPFLWRRWAMPVAACALLVIFAGVWFVSFPAPEPSLMTAQVPEISSSPIDILFAKAENLRAERDFTGAIGVLAEIAKDYPKDRKAAEAQLQIADIEFSDLQRYPHAYEAYETVRNNSPESWNDAPAMIKDRFDLLSEACTKDFEPLYALDAARSGLDTSFDKLEQLVVRYPGSLVAALAVDAMCDQVAEEADAIPIKAAALESVRQRCKTPIAIAQVNVALGDMYWRVLHEPQKAREYYAQVIKSPHADLAKVAQAALFEIENTP